MQDTNQNLGVSVNLRTVKPKSLTVLLVVTLTV